MGWSGNVDWECGLGLWSGTVVWDVGPGLLGVVLSDGVGGAGDRGREVEAPSYFTPEAASCYLQ